MNPNIIVKFELVRKTENICHFETSRSNSIKEIGYKNHTLRLYISYIPTILDFKNWKHFLKGETFHENDLLFLTQFINKFNNFGIKIFPASEQEISDIFKINRDLIKTTRSIETSVSSIGIIRLFKQSSNELGLYSLEKCLMKICDLKITVSVVRLPEMKAKLILEKRLKQLSSQDDVSSKLQSRETEESLKKQFSTGAQLFDLEFLITIDRGSQKELSDAMSQVIAEFNAFSDFKVEMYGLAESYIATHPASNQHVAFLESEECLPAFLPLFLKSDLASNVEKRSLTLFRENQTLSHFDLFSPSYNCFNSLIVGTSGKGKSVLTGLLTQALLNDPQISVIKVDVGGSHSKECELFGGTELTMKLDQPSGINPFLVIKENVSESEKIGILSKFVSVLILEHGETMLTKDVRAKIEESIGFYILSSPVKPSLNDFYEKTTEFPRRNLLKRWAHGGIYEAAFKTSEIETLCNTRLRYYNFSQVFQASDPEFAQAGIAAVLAQFNIDSTLANGKRLVLMCDETPFFIKTCFEFFKFSTANVRKYGHAVVLIGQLSTDFVVNGDHGIVENSPQRFLFSVDGKPHEYKERFNLTNEKLVDIQNLKTIPREYSEVLLQSGQSGKVLRIKITPEEYWTLTTSQPDQLKIMQLRSAVPTLKLSEALKCLSLF
ncbi:MAG: hypothetical protein H7336_15375 [Bacteriovorax sp.]|nr:hypothetical protein [Bacteriovorax sp.]